MTTISRAAVGAILMSGAMVRAMLDGRKSQTRRVLKPQPVHSPEIEDNDLVVYRGDTPVYRRQLPYHPGQLLWFREAFNSTWGPEIIYRADGGSAREAGYSSEPKWKLGTHMSRRLSRLTLEVTAVKVERLQDISEEDAVAEGIEEVTHEIACRDKSARFWKRYRDGGWNGYVDCPINSFASLWTEINGPGSWEANPWIVAVTFKPHRQNIDQFIAARKESSP